MPGTSSWNAVQDPLPAAYLAAYVGGAFCLVLVSTLVVAYLFGPLYWLVTLSAILMLVVFARPAAGLWLSPCLVMVASLVAPPQGFQYGVGNSPELPYWAVAICLVFLAQLGAYFCAAPSARGALTRLPASPPRALYGFLAISIFAAALGLWHGYSPANVAKQFYGCLLFVAYFLFALRFAPGEQQVLKIMRRVYAGAVIAALAYLAIYFVKATREGIHKDLTVLSAYAAGVAILLIPNLFAPGGSVSRAKVWISCGILLAVPFFAGYKRGLASFLVCGLIAVGLRSGSARKRLLTVTAGFLFVSLLLGTSLLNPLIEATGRLPFLSQFLLTDNVQTNYSVFLRVQELGQILDSLRGVPLLGTGLGSTFQIYDAYSHEVYEQETVDIGWGYLLVKMGVVGIGIFLWLVLGILRRGIRTPLSGLQVALFLLLIFALLQMLADTFMVYFMTAGWVGSICGFLYQSLQLPAGAWSAPGILGEEA
jgi:hypothetical protein